MTGDGVNDAPPQTGQYWYRHGCGAGPKSQRASEYGAHGRQLLHHQAAVEEGRAVLIIWLDLLPGPCPLTLVKVWSYWLPCLLVSHCPQLDTNFMDQYRYHRRSAGPVTGIRSQRTRSDGASAKTPETPVITAELGFQIGGQQCRNRRFRFIWWALIQKEHRSCAHHSPSICSFW